MPVRDAGAWLAEAVASILGQSHHDLELILVDDHSTDRAIAELAKGDGRLQILENPGRGVVGAFNAGLAVARGGYIARMDADDLAMPQRLEAQLQLLRERPEVGIAGACVEIFSDQGLQEGNRHYQDWLNGLCAPDAIHQAMFIESPIPNPTALFRRAVIDALGGYRDTEWPEDYDLFLRADRAGMELAKPAGVQLRWRDHDGRLTRCDARYSRSRFQAAKAHYLVHGRLGSPDGLLLWGSGPSGREMYDLLVAEGAGIDGFVDVHPRRIGGTKRGLPVWPIERALSWDRGMLLVAVGARGARKEIREFLHQGDRREGQDYLFVA
jgi:glycosyltransferase involved in cell wall biosynthesis